MIEAVKARIKMDENLTDVQRRQDNVDKLGLYCVQPIQVSLIMHQMKAVLH